ncbi:hypothetical protein [Bacillus sp. FJAT-28004]|uniref:hypothetical protein n=1 Tax=Bacillus sp. FJAT-28004 TaxID=1679165 RepID=UPI00128EA818|nr:hypothetical protein [Bacillus sp. FJAT-28004]
MMNRWVVLRVIGFGALTYFLLRYTVDEHFNLYDMIPVAILAGIAVNEIFIRRRKLNNNPPPFR